MMWNFVLVVFVKYLRNVKINVSNVIYFYFLGNLVYEDF